MAINSVSSVQQSPVKKAAKVVAGTALAAGVIAAGLIAGSKTDAFTKAGKMVAEKLGEGKGQDIAAKVGEKLNSVGKQLEKTGQSAIKTVSKKVSGYKLKDSTVYKEAGKLAQDAKKAAQALAKQVKDVNIPEQAQKLLEQIKQKIIQ